jgi:diguanylate cyclase (GGDEF)-like protein
MFGMVMAVTGRARYELETVNADLSRARERLETMSRTDQLTATLNRRAFSAVLGDRSRDGRPVKHGVIAIIDLDDLKALNDLYGHAAGDAALIALAAGLRSCVRSEDLLFRWGGDEFVLMLMNETLPGAESRLAVLEDRLRATPVPGSDTPVNLHASRGFALFDGVEFLNAALVKADEAMYRQKRAG